MKTFVNDQKTFNKTIKSFSKIPQKKELTLKEQIEKEKLFLEKTKQESLKKQLEKEKQNENIRFSRNIII